MPSDNKDNPSDTGDELPSLELSGRFIRRREPQEGAHDPYDTSHTFEGLKPPIELFRRQRSFKDHKRPPESGKRVKFEILDDKQSKGGGYDPYGSSE
ncbi:MAG TPA: hypothetical protein VGC50_14510 [Gammaproteobacteria bacterium]|jgi:hypothetical protein